MWPMPGVVALSEHLVGLSLIATPLQWAGASPIAAYNICVVATYALSGYFAYLLAHRLTGSTAAAVCAGMAFGFSPYRAGALAHVQVLASHWMPLVLLSLHAYVDTGAMRWVVIFGIAWLLQALSNGYYLLFLPVLIVLWLAWFVDWARMPGRGVAVVSAWVIASLPLIPILLKYRAVHGALGLERGLSDIRNFSALPASFLSAPPLLYLWPTGSSANTELHLFPGVTAVLVTVVGLLALFRMRGIRAAVSSRSPLLFYATATIVMFVLALGPISNVHPYTWLLELPGFTGLRVPARFAMVASLTLAVAAGLALSHLPALIGRWSGAIALCVLTGIAADGMTVRVPTAAPPPRIALPAGLDHAAVIELPLYSGVSVDAMYRSIFHRRVLVNGYSGHTPPHYDVLSLALARGDASPLLFLARGRPLVVVVHDDAYRAMVEALPGVERHGISAAGPMYILPPQLQPSRMPASAPLQAEVRALGDRRVQIDLGRSTALSALVIPLKGRYRDLAERLLIEGSDDGVTWREMWRGWTGALAVEATLTDPQIGRVEIPLVGVSTRYLRAYPAAEWMSTEVSVR